MKIYMDTITGSYTAGPEQAREAIGEGPIHTTVGRKICFRRAPVVNLGFYGKLYDPKKWKTI